MSLIKYRNGINNQFPAVSDIFDQFFERDFFETPFSSLSRSTVPAVNISESDDAYTLELAVPGRKKDDFKVELDNHVLSISAETSNEKSESDDKNKVTRREFTYQTFKRSFTLPDNVNTEQVKATYNEGVLKLEIEKVPELKPKLIDIK
ncbi:MAG: Hsp20/alpha crystallin family protein [Bacteroidota bacterium]